MNLSLPFNFWDILLILVVTVQSTVLAYLYHPQWKSFMLTLPFPFTVAVFAVGKPINATNMFGLILLLFFSHCVRILYNTHKINIFPAIAISVMFYCILGWLANKFLPTTPCCFWIAAILVFFIAILGILIQSHKNEQGQKSSMPIWLKLLVLFCIVFVLIMLKKSLSGFVTVFPMVGVVAAYEARKSLWTVSRQIPVIMLTLGPLIMIIYIFQDITGIYYAMAIGWLVFLLLLLFQVAISKTFQD